MTKKTRILALIIAVISCVFSLTTMLTGCNAASRVKMYKVGVSIYSFDDNFMTLYRGEIENYFKSLETDNVKYEVIILDAKRDQNEQTIQVVNFIEQKFDVMIINLKATSAADLITAKAKAAKIPVVYINREPCDEDMKAWNKICYIGSDGWREGACQGEIIRDLPNHGDTDGDGVVRYVMIIGDPENTNAQYRSEYSIKALTDAGIQVEELMARRGDWEMVKGQEITANALAQFGSKIDVIFSNNDAMAIGAIQAIKSAGRKVGKDIYLVGIDAIPEAVEAVAAGDMTGTLRNDHIGQAHAAVDAAVRYINGKDNDTYTWVDFVKITAADYATNGAALEPQTGALSFSFDDDGNYTGFSSIPQDYTSEQAANDGCYVLDGVIIDIGDGRLRRFIEDSNNKKDSSVRIMKIFDEGTFYSDLFYIDGKYRAFDSSSEDLSDHAYDYILELKGRMPNAARDSYYVVLTDDKELSFKNVYTKFISSSMDVINSISPFEIIVIGVV